MTKVEELDKVMKEFKQCENCVNKDELKSMLDGYCLLSEVTNAIENLKTNILEELKQVEQSYTNNINKVKDSFKEENEKNKENINLMVKENEKIQKRISGFDLQINNKIDKSCKDIIEECKSKISESLKLFTDNISKQLAKLSEKEFVIEYCSNLSKKIDEKLHVYDELYKNIETHSTIEKMKASIELLEYKLDQQKVFQEGKFNALEEIQSKIIAKENQNEKFLNSLDSMIHDKVVQSLSITNETQSKNQTEVDTKIRNCNIVIERLQEQDCEFKNNISNFNNDILSINDKLNLVNLKIFKSTKEIEAIKAKDDSKDQTNNKEGQIQIMKRINDLDNKLLEFDLKVNEKIFKEIKPEEINSKFDKMNEMFSTSMMKINLIKEEFSKFQENHKPISRLILSTNPELVKNVNCQTILHPERQNVVIQTKITNETSNKFVEAAPYVDSKHSQVEIENISNETQTKKLELIENSVQTIPSVKLKNLESTSEMTIEITNATTVPEINHEIIQKVTNCYNSIIQSKVNEVPLDKQLFEPYNELAETKNVLYCQEENIVVKEADQKIVNNDIIIKDYEENSDNRIEKANEFNPRSNVGRQNNFENDKSLNSEGTETLTLRYQHSHRYFKEETNKMIDMKNIDGKKQEIIKNNSRSTILIKEKCSDVNEEKSMNNVHDEFQKVPLLSDQIDFQSIDFNNYNIDLDLNVEPIESNRSFKNLTNQIASMNALQKSNIKENGNENENKNKNVISSQNKKELENINPKLEILNVPKINDNKTLLIEANNKVNESQKMNHNSLVSNLKERSKSHKNNETFEEENKVQKLEFEIQNESEREKENEHNLKQDIEKEEEKTKDKYNEKEVENFIKNLPEESPDKSSEHSISYSPQSVDCEPNLEEISGNLVSEGELVQDDEEINKKKQEIQNINSYFPASSKETDVMKDMNYIFELNKNEMKKINEKRKQDKLNASKKFNNEGYLELHHSVSEDFDNIEDIEKNYSTKSIKKDEFVVQSTDKNNNPLLCQENVNNENQNKNEEEIDEDYS